MDHVTANCIVWNRVQMERANNERNNPDRNKAIEACRNASRFARNVETLMNGGSNG